MRMNTSLVLACGAVVAAGVIGAGSAWAGTTAPAARARAATVRVCDARQLEVSILDVEPGMSHLDYTVQVRNMDVKDACRIPKGLAMTIIADAGPVATVHRDGPVRPVVLGARKTATTYLTTLASADTLPRGARCSAYGFLQVKVPGARTDALTMDTTDTKIRSCGEISASPLTLDR
jgi:hypothetical protein